MDGDTKVWILEDHAFPEDPIGMDAEPFVRLDVANEVVDAAHRVLENGHSRSKAAAGDRTNLRRAIYEYYKATK